VQKVKLLAICGSPRPTGNSRYLLDQAVDEALAVGADYVEAEVFSIAKKTYAPCTSCFQCATVGDCIIEDDFQELRDKWAEADAVIYSMPVYHMAVPGQLKCFIDRLGNSLWAYYGGVTSKSLKVIGCIVQGSHIFAGQEHTITQIVNHALVMGCLPISGDTWESYTGGAGWTANSAKKNAIRKLCEGEDYDAQVALKATRSVGRRVVQAALLVKAGGEVHRELLEADGGYSTFLRRVEG